MFTKHAPHTPSANAEPTHPPKYIYKILPATPPSPSPLPTHLTLSGLDYRDNFI